MILRLFTQNLGWKLSSLLVAIAFWMNVASEPELATIVSIPVQYANYPKDLEISSAIVDSVDVEARGPRGRLRDLADSRVAAVLNFNTVVAPGIRTFALTDNEVKLPRGLELIRVIPAQLRFTFERRSERIVPVEVILSGKLRAGYRVTGKRTNPATIAISGPESQVEKTNSVRTDPFDISQLTGDAEQVVSVFVDQPQVRIKDDKQQIRARINIGRSNQ